MSKKVREPDEVSMLSLVTYDKSNKVIESGGYNRQAIALIMDVPTMSDEDLKQMFTTTNEARRLMFVVNGAISYEIYKRACDRGETFTTRKGEGVSELFRDLSVSSGLELATLRDDFRIFDEFGIELVECLAVSPDRIMPREFYCLAVRTPNPQETLRYFEEQRDSVTYYVAHARRDTKKFNEGLSVAEVRRQDLAEREVAVQVARLSATSEAELWSDADEPTVTPTVERSFQVSLPSNQISEYYVREIVGKYGSFRNWFFHRAAEEFGEAE